MPAAMPIASEITQYGAAIGSTVPELMKLVIRPARPPTHGPARRPPRTVPIESRNSGSFNVVASAWPAQSMAMQTGMRTIASVFSLNLNASSTPKVKPLLVPWSPKASTLLLRGLDRGLRQHQHGPRRAGAPAAPARRYGGRRPPDDDSGRQGREPGGRGGPSRRQSPDGRTRRSG